MKKTILLLCLVLLLAFVGFTQSVTLTFTGRDGGNRHIELEYVIVTNVTKGWQESLFWPDTVLTIQAETGVQDVETMSGLSLRISPHSPNPFNGITDVTLTVAEEGLVNLEITDMNGRVVWADDYKPLPGVHQFRVALAHAGLYVMTAHQNGKISSIKMVCNKGENVNTVEYVGAVATAIRETMTPKSHTRGLVTRPFDIGDQMQYVGYAIINYEEEESQCVEQPLTDSQIFVLPFSSTQLGFPTVITANITNITDNSAVCGGQVTDDGGDTMAVRGVCVGLMPSPTVFGRHTVDGHGMGAFTSQLTGLSSNLTYYVRAYVKNDLGIAYGEDRIFTIPVNPNGDVWSCPDGWHVPSDVECTQLINYVRSQSQNWCGGDSLQIGKSLAATVGWDLNGPDSCTVGNPNFSTNNATGFGALPAGYYTMSAMPTSGSEFGGVGYVTFYWSSTGTYNSYGYNDIYYWGLHANYALVIRNDLPDTYGDAHSVRCVKD